MHSETFHLALLDLLAEWRLFPELGVVLFDRLEEVSVIRSSVAQGAAQNDKFVIAGRAMGVGNRAPFIARVHSEENTEKEAGPELPILEAQLEERHRGIETPVDSAGH